jgi:hypothetical protein
MAMLNQASLGPTQAWGHWSYWGQLGGLKPSAWLQPPYLTWMYPWWCDVTTMDTSNAALVRPILGLFTPPQGPFCRPWAAPIQPLSTGVSRGHVRCLVLHLCSPFWGFCTPHWAHFTGGGCPIPYPFGSLQLCLHSLFWFFISPCHRLGASPVTPTFLHAAAAHRLLLIIQFPI